MSNKLIMGIGPALQQLGTVKVKDTIKIISSFLAYFPDSEKIKGEL
jgi:hypothetical protein